MDTTIYAQNVTINHCARKMYTYDDTSNEHIAYVEILGDFLYYVGDPYSAHKDIRAVICIAGGNPEATLVEALRNGIVNGRDDRI